LTAAIDAKYSDRAPFSDLVEVDDDSWNSRSLRYGHGDASARSSSGGNSNGRIPELVYEGRSPLCLIDMISVDFGVDFLSNLIVVVNVVLKNLRQPRISEPHLGTLLAILRKVFLKFTISLISTAALIRLIN
jgi:hypothetical protein